MNKLVESTLTKDSKTLNGMLTHSTSLNKCLDFFALAGASRNMSENDITKLFTGAFAENPNFAAKILFWARDIRGGAGERRLFRICMMWLSENYPAESKLLTEHIPEFGRWDDIFYGDSDQAIESIIWALASANSLCAKWMPRKGPIANQLRKEMDCTPKEYRKALVALTNVVETRMCKKEWNQITYKGIPSKAFSKYQKAFWKNDPTRFESFLNDVKEGKSSINAGAIFPHDVIKSYINDYDATNNAAITEQWNALPNYMEGSTERILPVCDVSGSMNGTPMDVSISLGLYISERNEGAFKDAFMTFSANPEMQYLKGDVFQRVQQLSQADWSMNTDLQLTFKTILSKAVSEKVPVNEMPTKLLIISDMEFDAAHGDQWSSYDEVSEWNPTAMEMIKNEYKQSGYEMPGIVFWNVNGRAGSITSQATTENTALVSGFSPAILTSVLSGKITHPLQVMIDTIQNERYNIINI